MAQAATVKASDFDDAPARDADLFLLDGSSLAFRSFFALPQEIATSDGRPTGALLGFANMLYKLVSDYQPRYVGVAWDLPGGTFRSEMYDEYKSHRPEMPDLLQQQWPHFQPLAEAFGFENLALDRYEADDVIGTLATRAAAQGMNVCIVTYDRDALQLVSDRVVVMMTTRGVSEVAVYTPKRVELRYGIKPEMVPDFIALKGDTSDNIPGVPGIGDKTAAKLLSEFGTLSELLENVDKVSGAKRQENLRAFTEQAAMSRKLATIVCDLDLPLGPADLEVRPLEPAALAAAMHTYEFRALARRISELDAASASGAGAAGAGGANEQVPNAEAPDTAQSPVAAPAPVAEAPQVTQLTVSARSVSTAELESLLSDAASAGTTVPIAVRSEDGVASVAALLADDQAVVSTGTVRALGRAIQGTAIHAFDYKSWPQALRTGTLVDDEILAAYLIDPARRLYLIDDIAGELAISCSVDSAGLSAQDTDLAMVAGLLPAVAAAQRERLEAAGMLDLYREIELPLVEVLVDMEEAGIGLDVYRLAEINRKVADQLAELTDQAHELAGEEFNIASPQQLSQILFEKLGLPTPQKKGRTGFSTDARVLRDLRDTHPLIPKVEKYRELSKLKGTYLDALPELVEEKTGRIHTTFSQITAATGRLSSINPNLQNIPVRTALGREIRSAFVPAQGFRFVSCDYSQVELRLLAALSGEPKLIDAFTRGDDVHRMTAAEVHDLDPSAITREQRNAAKAINFGIIYGISSFGLSQQLQISRDEAQAYIDRYLGRYPQVGDFIERTIEQARADGFVTTEFGRRRLIPEFRSRNFNTRQLAERLAVNTRLQGTAADIMKIAMIRVHAALAEQKMRSQVVLQIHDELLVEAAEDEIREVGELVRGIMVGAYEMTPPLAVDVGAGDTWLDAH